MGLACSQARLLTLTQRKADCEFNISVASMHKMALTREASELSQEYYSRIQAKQVSYYANGQYNKMNYEYLMGYGSNYSAITHSGSYPLKENNSMLLTDYKGQVVLSDSYAKAITSVLGTGTMDKYGRGGTFSTDDIAKILSALCPNFTKEEFQTVIDNGNLQSSYAAENLQTLTGEMTGTSSIVNNSTAKTDTVKAIVDFYYPIFAAAATNGWTTEYNKDMQLNDDYISDALVTGSLQLATVNNVGEYYEGNSLNYFVTAGFVEQRSNADAREEVTAWYNAEKERISEKETYYDLEIDNESTELEAINTEIQSIQSLIDDAISSVFDWGNA